MADTDQDEPNSIAVLLHEDAGGGIGLKIPEFAIEMYGEDLPELIEQAEEVLWQELEASGRAVPESAVLALKRVTKAEYGPTCYERRDEGFTRLEDE